MFHSCLGAYLVPVNFLDLLDARIRTAANFYIDLYIVLFFNDAYIYYVLLYIF